MSTIKKIKIMFIMIVSFVILICFSQNFLLKQTLLESSVNYQYSNNDLLKSIINEFQQDAYQRNIKIDLNDVYFSLNKNVNGNFIGEETSSIVTAGQCVKTIFGKKIIIINMLTKSIVYHELGHCLFNLTHVEGENEIMHSQIDFAVLDQKSIDNLFYQKADVEYMLMRYSEVFSLFCLLFVFIGLGILFKKENIKHNQKTSLR